MTNAAIARRPDFAPLNAVPEGLPGIARGLSHPDVHAVGAAVPAGAEPPPQTSASNGLTDALQVIVAYIPTEVLTLYVAVLTTLQSPAKEPLWVAFWGFLVGTPVVVWILFATKLNAAGRSKPWSPRQWPIWEMLAATVSFFVWAFALPGNPWAQSFHWYTPALAGVMALVVSALLALLAPLCQQPLKT